MKNEKLRLLYLLKILNELTDEEHPLSTNEIIEILDKEYGITVHRETLADDINQLSHFGVDIIKIKSTQSKYFIGSRTFELAEIKLLIDAVQSSKFITLSKSKELIDKLTDLAGNIHSENAIKRNIYVDKRIKPNNEYIYYIADTINDAINLNRKISFYYCYYTPDKKAKKKNDGKPYIFSPFSLFWNGDYYYVIGYSDKHKKVITFRVDRILSSPQILSEQAVPAPSDYDIADYSKQIYQMYEGEMCLVKLKCDNELMNNILDRFGSEVHTEPCDENSFYVIEEVSISPTFFGWIFGFCGRIKIIEPQSVKDQFKNMLSEQNK